jgi:Putative phage metallopeptidase
MAKWCEAPDVKRIADELIPKHHEHLILRADEIRYVFRDDTPTSKGRFVLGKARKVDGLACYLANAEPEAPNSFEDHEIADMFVIEISEPMWAQLTPAGRIALVDHELCHFAMDVDEVEGTVKRAIRGHSVEEFTEIVHRHGLWRPELENLARHMPQLTLPLDGEGGAE